MIFLSNLDVHSLGWINPDSSGAAGIWHIDAGGYSLVNKVGGYAFFAPQSWADTYAGGRSLIVGYHRGFGNRSSNGPTMFCVAPWAVGNPPTDGADIAATTLLLYPSIDTPEGGTQTDPITNFRPAYTMSDHAKGAVWIEFGGKRAVLFVGVAGTDNNFCYGPNCPSNICSPIEGPNDPPYSPGMWWYDVDDFEATAAGSLDVSGPAPYTETTPTEVYNGNCSTQF